MDVPVFLSLDYPHITRPADWSEKRFYKRFEFSLARLWVSGVPTFPPCPFRVDRQGKKNDFFNSMLGQFPHNRIFQKSRSLTSLRLQTHQLIKQNPLFVGAVVTIQTRRGRPAASAAWPCPFLSENVTTFPLPQRSFSISWNVRDARLVALKSFDRERWHAPPLTKP